MIRPILGVLIAILISSSLSATKPDPADHMVWVQRPQPGPRQLFLGPIAKPATQMKSAETGTPRPVSGHYEWVGGGGGPRVINSAKHRVWVEDDQ